MSRDFTGGGVLKNTSTPVTAVPLTLACFGISGAYGNQRAFNICVDGADSNCFWLGCNVTTGYLSAGSRAASVSAAAICTTAVSQTEWNHWCGVFTSATSRAAFVDGANKQTNATSNTPTGLNAIYVGAAGNATFAANGYLAHPAIWSAALSDEEVAALAAGASPLSIRPASLVFYAPWLGRDSVEIDIIGGRGLTVTTAAASANEPRSLWRPRSRRVYQAKDQPLKELRFYWSCEDTALSTDDYNAGFDTAGSLQNGGTISSTQARVGTNSLRGPASLNGGCLWQVDFSIQNSRLFPFGLTKDPLDTEGCVGFWSRYNTATYSSGTQRGFRFRSLASATVSLESNHVTGGTNYAFVIAGTGGSNTITTTGGVITANNWFFEVYRWDFPGGRMRLEIYDYGLNLVDSIEQTGITFTHDNVPPDIDTFIVGAKGGSNANAADFDNFMVAARYEAPLQDNALITNAAQYGKRVARISAQPKTRAA